GEKRCAHWHKQLQERALQGRREEERLKCEPLRNKAVKGRQRGDRHTAYKKKGGGPWHKVDESRHLLHVPLVRRMEYGAGAHEEKTLEHRVVQGVVDAGGEGQGRKKRHLERGED